MPCEIADARPLESWKVSIIIIEITAGDCLLLDKLLDGSLDGPELRLGVVSLDQPGQQILLVLGEEGEALGGVPGLELADLVLVEAHAAQFLQDGVGPILDEEKG